MTGWLRLLLAVFMLLGLAASQTAHAAVEPDDRDLYRTITERVSAGEGYYATAAAEQRAHGYPVRPALAMRPPTLAWFLALMPGHLARLAAFYALLLATLVCWRNALARHRPRIALAMVVLALAGLFGAMFPKAAYLHEQWSVLLVMLSLAAHRRAVLMVALALLAVLVRETALAWLAAIVVVALWKRDARTATLGTAAIALAAGLWLLHARHVAAVGLPGDLASQGWVRFHGLGMVTEALARNLVLFILPGWLSLALAAASLAAMLRWGGDIERIAAVGTAGFLLAMTVLGRSDSGYWGFMVAPFALLGLPLLVARLPLRR